MLGYFTTIFDDIVFRLQPRRAAWASATGLA